MRLGFASVSCGLLMLGTALTLGLASSTPRWVSPLEQDLGRSASFGEFRGDHLHAGIDFATGRRIGLPVRAAGDGRIVRLKVEWRGYGNAIYIEHENGDVTLYGHLDRFADALGLPALVEEARRKSGQRYPGDIFPKDPIPVRAGQTIAESGESGAGLPHLHFEYRRKGLEPIDPKSAGIPIPADTDPPVLHSVSVLPARVHSIVEGKPWRAQYPLSPRIDRPGTFERAPPISVSGPFRLALEADDPTPLGHRTGLLGWSIAVDDREISSFRIARMSFRTYFLAAECWNAEASSAERGVFTAQLAPPPRDLLGPSRGSAEVELSPGPHKLEIRGFDQNGNVASAFMRFVSEASPPFDREPPNSALGYSPSDIQEVESRDDGIVLRVRREPRGVGTTAPQKATTEAAWLERVIAGDDRFILFPSDALDGRSAGLPSGLRPDGSFAVSSSNRAIDFTARGSLVPLTIELPKSRGLVASRRSASEFVAKEIRSLAARPGSFARQSEVVHIGPNWSPDVLGVKFRSPIVDKRVGLYRFDPVEERWLPVGASRPGGKIEARPRRAGLFALFEDDRPPILEAAGMTDDPRLGQLLVVDAWDPESGLDRESVVIVVDSSASLVGELDPDRGIAFWKELPRAPFRIEVTDRAGNVSKLGPFSPESLPKRPMYREALVELSLN